MAKVQYIGTGRRKNAVARVRLVPGTGKIIMNKKAIEVMFFDQNGKVNKMFAHYTE